VTEPRRRQRFATTHWSLVLTAGGPRTPASHDALATLCETYWYPLYAYARRVGHGVEEAEDLVQAFFVRILEKQALQHADPERGRFRSFLLASLKHFMLNEYNRARAAKRGGGQPIESIDVSGAEGRYALEPRDEANPERLFERQWALTILDRVHARLRSVSMRSGKGQLFEQLKDFVTGEETDTPYREAAESLGMSEGAARVAIHRLRRRFRDLLREEIEHTVADPAEVDDEIRFMLVTLATAAGSRR
jgi:RNA polymerase sigma-70 factor (ECF subfamily)